MALWGKSTSAASRPKFLPDDSDATDSGGSREEAFATTGGWALRPGQGNSGNDNTSAQAEVLVAIRNLSGTLGAANILSVDFTAGTYAHAGSTDFDVVYTFDEAVTVTSAAATADNTVSNKVKVDFWIAKVTDMSKRADMKMQYYSGTGTNTITFRGRIPAAGAAGDYISGADATYAMATDGTSAVVDGDGTTVTAVDGDHGGGSAVGGPDAGTAIWGTGVNKTGSSTATLTTTAGSSSGSLAVLTGVVLG
jgi:hypothetical protein